MQRQRRPACLVAAAGLGAARTDRRAPGAWRVGVRRDAGRQLYRSGVEQADLKDYRILHFATHALLPAELRCEDEPAIVTSDPPGARDASGALLTASDIVGLHLDANLVILSACNSGGPGGAVAGESLSGLARAFFYAGARSLLVTHWSVNDQAAAFLVVDTLSGCARPQGGAQRGASPRRCGVRSSGLLDAAGHAMPAELAHPFFWAPFAVIGEGGEAASTVASVRASP